jgi:hypothetical protein
MTARQLADDSFLDHDPLGRNFREPELTYAQGVEQFDSSFCHGLDPLRRRTGFEARLELSRERSIVFIVGQRPHFGGGVDHPRGPLVVKLMTDLTRCPLPVGWHVAEPFDAGVYGSVNLP